MRLTNEMIYILTTKVVDELKKNVNVDDEYAKIIPDINKDFDKIEKFSKKIEALEKELKDTRTKKYEITGKLSKQYYISADYTNRERFLELLKDNLIQSKIPSTQNIKTEILLSGNTDLSQLIETLVKKFTNK